MGVYSVRSRRSDVYDTTGMTHRRSGTTEPKRLSCTGLLVWGTGTDVTTGVPLMRQILAMLHSEEGTRGLRVRICICQGASA